MKLINSKVEILDELDGSGILKKLEKVARTCYKSEQLITEDDSSAKKLISNIIKSGHEAMIEHVSVSVKFTCSRAISHEIVRHRVSSFAQESQRYCNYSKDKFNNEITFIIPTWIDESEESLNSEFRDTDKDDVSVFVRALRNAEEEYFTLLNNGLLPQQARDVLPNATKTEIVMTANLREWRHFFKLRCDTPAHPDMRKLALDLLGKFHKAIPVVFDDLYDKFLMNDAC